MAANLEELLVSLPEKVMKKELAILHLTNSSQALKLTLEAQEQGAMAEVCQEKNGDGKAVYSNDNSRKAEVKLRLARDSVYHATQETYIQQLESLETSRIELRYLQGLFKAYNSIARMRGNPDYQPGRD